MNKAEYYQKNKDVILLKRATYYQQNRESIAVYQAIYRKENREDMISYSKTYYKENKDSLLKNQSIYNQKNREIIAPKKAIYNVEYRKNNPGKFVAYSANRRSLKVQRTPIWVSLEELEQIKIVYEIAANMFKLDGVQYDVDHIVPLKGIHNSVSGFHTLLNLQIITHTANMLKSNKFLLE